MNDLPSLAVPTDRPPSEPRRLRATVVLDFEDRGPEANRIRVEAVKARAATMGCEVVSHTMTPPPPRRGF